MPRANPTRPAGGCLDFSNHELRDETILLLHYESEGGQRLWMGASIVFQVLAASTKALSPVHTHGCAARLRLATHREQADDRYEFETLLTLSLTCHFWQEAQIHAPVLNPPPKQKVGVRFLTPENHCANAKHQRRRRLALKSKPLMRLNLASSRIEHPIARSDPQLSLRDIIQYRPGSLTEKVKRVVAVILAYSVLHLNDTPWLCPSSFRTDNILFYSTSTTTPLKPYIYTEIRETNHCETASDALDAEVDPDDLPSQPYPNMVMLAIMLIEPYLTEPAQSLAAQVGMECDDWDTTDENTRYLIAITAFDRFGNTIRIERLDEIARTMDISSWGKGDSSVCLLLNPQMLVAVVATKSTPSDGSVPSQKNWPAQALLDEIHPSLPQGGSDRNTYTLGRMGEHNVVIACILADVIGTVSAARVANSMLSTFRWLRFGLMVGIGGRVPGEQDVRLGDVVVGEPTGPFGGVIQYDFGKTVQNGEFLRTGSLNRPPDLLLTAISRLKADHYRKHPKLDSHLRELVDKYPDLSADFSYPVVEYDMLFQNDYDHNGNNASCRTCDSGKLVQRNPRSSHSSQITTTREQLRSDLDVICFEMEAAGVVDVFPCLSFGNKVWRGYAAATAAAYAKALLDVISGSQIDNVERLESFQP
ncbi:hypothetical protein BDW62DRAFT_211219 [Aspergillus aurantiobrunneus]